MRCSCLQPYLNKKLMLPALLFYPKNYVNRTIEKDFGKRSLVLQIPT